MKTLMTDQSRPAADFQICRDITRRYAKSFYFSSHVLPREKRMDAYAVYAFCRHADNIVDEANRANGSDAVERSIDEFRAKLDRLYDGSRMEDPVLRALQFSVGEAQIPKSYFEDLLTGVRMDITKTRYASFAELERYCYHVASVVGLMMAKVFRVPDSDALRYAEDLGIAMQLTNILRDIREDYERGRVYVPSEELNAFGITEADIASRRAGASFVNLMKFQIDRARRYYRSAAAGFEALPDDGSRLCVRLMASTYAGILDAIERQEYDVFARRAAVPTGRKLAILLRDLILSVKPDPGAPETLPRPANDYARKVLVNYPHQS